MGLFENLMTSHSAERGPNEWDRIRYDLWAESIGKDVKWVDKMFRFKSDGTVEARGDLDFTENELVTELPPNLKHVRGNVDFSNSTVRTFAEGLTVDGYMIIANCLISQIPENLKVHKYLVVANVPESEYESLITKLPDSLFVDEEILINEKQSDDANHLFKKGNVGGVRFAKPAPFGG